VEIGSQRMIDRHPHHVVPTWLPTLPTTSAASREQPTKGAQMNDLTRPSPTTTAPTEPSAHRHYPATTAGRHEALVDLLYSGALTEHQFQVHRAEINRLASTHHN
jgi:hypothetical protein